MKAKPLSEYEMKKCGEFCFNKDNENIKFSILEFLIKYRNDIATVYKGGRYLWEKNIKLAGNVINTLPDGFSSDVMNITEADLYIGTV